MFVFVAINNMHLIQNHLFFKKSKFIPQSCIQRAIHLNTVQRWEAMFHRFLAPHLWSPLFYLCSVAEQI